MEGVESDELNLPETAEMQMSAPVDFSLASNKAMAPHPEQSCLPIGPSYAKVSLLGRITGWSDASMAALFDDIRGLSL